MERFAIIGFGCAGYHALCAIRRAGNNANIDIYSDTDLPPYNPMLTTYYVADKLSYSGLFPFGTLEDIIRDKEANLFIKTRIKKVCVDAKMVETENGEIRYYDKILIATGAKAFIPNNLFHLKSAFCMRTVEDSVRMRTAIETHQYKDAIVVGASMVGIKVAEILHNHGCHVTLVDMAPHIFALAAYPEFSEIIEERLRKMGISFILGKAITEAVEQMDEQKNVVGYKVKFSDETTVETEVLVLNIGTRATVDFLMGEKIDIDRGILVDEHMRTSVPGIYAAGDCCQGSNLQSGEKQIIGLWANAGMQGNVAGANMAGEQAETDGNILHNITHFLDMDFIGLGDNRITGEVKFYQSPDKRFCIQTILRNNKPVGFNILDNYGISGILKDYLIKILRGQPAVLSAIQRGQLLRYGLTEDFIAQLEERV